MTARTVSLIGLWLAGFWLATPLWAAAPTGYPFLPYGEAMALARQQEKPVFLYLGRYGCSTCRKMNKEVFTNGELKQRYTENYLLSYVDTESGERLSLPNGERVTEMEFASRLRILGTPTFFFLASDERPLLKRVGFHDIEAMRLYDDYVTGGHYKTQTLKEFKTNR